MFSLIPTITKWWKKCSPLTGLTAQMANSHDTLLMYELVPQGSIPCYLKFLVDMCHVEAYSHY